MWCDTHAHHASRARNNTQHDLEQAAIDASRAEYLAKALRDALARAHKNAPASASVSARVAHNAEHNTSSSSSSNSSSNTNRAANGALVSPEWLASMLPRQPPKPRQ
jgi:hypothetical protein